MQELVLRYRQPATDFETEALPIGNGALGAALFGGVVDDRIALNEKTLWTGGPGSSHDGEDYQYGWWPSPRPDAIRAVREQIATTGTADPTRVAELLGGQRQKQTYGAYQPFADLLIGAHGDAPDEVITGEPTDYARCLDLREAVATVAYRIGDDSFRREYFASHPAGVIVIRLEGYSEPPRLALDTVHDGARVTPLSGDGTATRGGSAGGSVGGSGAGSIVEGIVVNGRLPDNGLLYHGQLVLRAEGDRAWTLLFAAGTDYAVTYPYYRGIDPSDAVAGRIEAAAAKPYADLRSEHVADHRALFDRVELTLGTTQPSAGPDSVVSTDAKLTGYDGTSQVDRELEALYFQYGRYLLIASSRPGSLPANLQGIWNVSTTPAWSADYHVNINLQMNYWPAEVTNLAETTGPLYDFIEALLPPGRVAAERIYGAEGWALGNETNPFGFTGVHHHPTSFWFPEAAAWLCRHLWEHYLFGLDLDFLRDRAYPVLAETCRFWLSFLTTERGGRTTEPDGLTTEDDSGRLVVSPSYSPEHGPFTAGASMAQQVVTDLFNATIAASTTLDVDAELRSELARTLDRLDPGLRIGSWGQLQEWAADQDDPTDQHRHVSHLYALHPGVQISPLTTPELAEAAEVTLRARGDGGTGWSKAWKVNFWARLLDGDHAHRMLTEQLLHSTLPNLWDTHPPFQIDGNFGATAGIAEMLLQSHLCDPVDGAPVVHALPALPAAWPDGSVTGLRARGGVTVDIAWRGGRAERVVLRTDRPCRVHLRVGDGASEALDLRPDTTTRLDHGYDPSVARL